MKIKPGQVAIFMLLISAAFGLAILTTFALAGLPLGDFRGIFLSVICVIFVYLFAIILYRIFLAINPLGEGEIIEGSRQEFAAQVHILFYLVLFNSLIKTHVLPIPLMRVVYQALGARLGRNTYSAGAILEPVLTYIGENCIIGHDAVLYSHAIEGRRFSFSAIRMGNDVTVGAHAIVMSGVTVGDGAIISAGAVVTKDTQIAPGEVWGGVPARRIRAATDCDASR